MDVREVEGAGFRHLVIERSASKSTGRLHIYIEGDGIPWIGNLPSDDPTPRNTLALRLMNLDEARVAYVGRPCYFGVPAMASHRCNPEVWTSHRYSPDVVRSMAAVIDQIRSAEPVPVVLIGHSGGGVLAVLIASELSGVAGVLTVAANLDTDAWTRHHEYDALVGSINPMSAQRSAGFPHLQYVGSDDEVVPPETSKPYAGSHAGVSLTEVDGFGHVCCWERAWPGILLDASREFAGSIGNQRQTPGPQKMSH